MEQLSVVVKRASVYGRELIYPECSNAKLFAELTGRKTLMLSDLQVIEKLGFEVIWKAEIPEGWKTRGKEESDAGTKGIGKSVGTDERSGPDTSKERPGDNGDSCPIVNGIRSQT